MSEEVSKKSGLIERLEQGIVRGDGAMGYLLTRGGISRNQSFDFLNIENPDLVASVHRQYLEAAQVDLIQTNTFGANRFHLTSFGRSHEKFVEIINKAGVDIARQAVAGTHCLVGGSIGPLTHSTGDSLGSKLGDPVAIREAYEEQILALGQAGIDCFVIETVHSHVEGITALQLAKELFPDIPIVFQVASTTRGETVARDDLETLIRDADREGADCVGLNCFLDPAEMYDQILEIQQWTMLPITAQPNLGKRAQLCQGIFEAERSLKTTVSTFGSKMIEAGVRLIGGCCGITPDHISQVKDLVDHIAPADLRRYRELHKERYDRARRVTVGDFRKRPDYIPTLLEQELRRDDPVHRPIVVEVDPPRIGETPKKFIAGAKQLFEAGIKIVSIGDNPGRVPRMDRNTFANLLKREVPELELVLHISCADQTLVRFATELESLHYLSRNVLVITGDPPSGEYARSSAPYDFRSVSGIRAFSRRNHGFGLTGQEELAATDYFVGAALNPRALEPQMRKFWTKSANAGASYCLTQPLFDKATLSDLYQSSTELRARLKEERGRDCFFLPGVMSLFSARNARILRQEFGMPVPKELIREMEGMKTKKAARARGREVTREMLSLIRDDFGFQGLYVVTQFHNYKSTIADLRATAWLPE
ncbi:MAG: homocysteine S-methyltransferase family protein [Planctomycetota bacterium]|nr:homocysteine S-methyltransferase family protein [Planctomycetota bacterium]